MGVGSHEEKDFPIAENSHPGNAYHPDTYGGPAGLHRGDAGPNSNIDTNGRNGDANTDAAADRHADAHGNTCTHGEPNGRKGGDADQHSNP